MATMDVTCQSFHPQNPYQRTIEIRDHGMVFVPRRKQKAFNGKEMMGYEKGFVHNDPFPLPSHIQGYGGRGYNPYPTSSPYNPEDPAAPHKIS
jgi:hypothetical protein